MILKTGGSMMLKNPALKGVHGAEESQRRHRSASPLARPSREVVGEYVTGRGV